MALREAAHVTVAPNGAAAERPAASAVSADFGPLDALLQDNDISDILVNGPKSIYVEKGGRLERTDVCFRDDEHLLDVINTQIRSIAGIRSTETFVYLRLEKQTYSWGT